MILVKQNQDNFNIGRQFIILLSTLPVKKKQYIFLTQIYFWIQEIFKTNV